MEISFSSTVTTGKLIEILNVLNSKENTIRIEEGIIECEVDMFRLETLSFKRYEKESLFFGDLLVHIAIYGNDCELIDNHNDCLRYYKLAKKLMNLLSGFAEE